jgi:hypothetical protein
MNRFKPGDKARVIGNGNGHGYKIREIVQVLERYPDERGRATYLCKGNQAWYVRECDLEPIEPVQEEESQLITLEELPAGSLFSFNGTIALKSEYRTENGAIEAFILGSGEMFWGGVTTAAEQTALLVTPIRGIEELKRNKEAS